MMKKYLLTILTGILLLPLAITENAQAQWELGASYEIRDEDPTKGFGLRIERDILSATPVVNLGLRAHFSYFSENNDVTIGSGESSLSYDREFESYDFGLAATGGVNVGLVTPYVGLGIGWDNSKIEMSEDLSGTGFEGPDSFDETDFYWNGFIGAKISIIPVVNPFIEYRFTKITDRDDIDLDNVSRLALGISLRF